MLELTKAARDVLAERERQKAVEGWTEAHDDAHDDGSLAQAAACYALPPFNSVVARVELWPESWGLKWWKPTTQEGDRRRELLKAGALILAEVERIDRLTLSGASTTKVGAP